MPFSFAIFFYVYYLSCNSLLTSAISLNLPTPKTTLPLGTQTTGTISPTFSFVRQFLGIPYAGPPLGPYAGSLLIP